MDRAGTLKVLLAGDGAAVLGRDLGRRKAYTAAIRRVPTTELAKAIAAPGAFNPTLYDTQLVTAGGGVPIKALRTEEPDLEDVFVSLTYAAEAGAV